MDTERPATPGCPYPSPYHRAMWAPLVRVSETLAASTRVDDSFFDIDDFMHMSWCREDRPEGLMLYKHIDTRHYLNLDTLGTAYAYFPPRTNDPSDHGTYRPHATLRDGIDRLELWSCPGCDPNSKRIGTGSSGRTGSRSGSTSRATASTVPHEAVAARRQSGHNLDRPALNGEVRPPVSPV